jgi:hypothetical protein
MGEALCARRRLRRQKDAPAVMSPLRDWPGMPSYIGAVSIQGKDSKWVTERGGAARGHLPTHEVRNPDLHSLAAR